MKVLFAIVIGFLLALSVVAVPSGTYNIFVVENGNSLVLLALEGEGMVELPLPLDVSYPVIEGAIYVQSARGVEISMNTGESAILAYKSSLLTSKIGDTWEFSFDTPPLNHTVVILSLPKNIELQDMFPEGRISTTENTTDIGWEVPSPTTITVSYSFSEQIVPPKTTTTSTYPTSTVTTLPSSLKALIPKSTDILTAILIIVLFAVIILVVLPYLRKRDRSGGQDKLMRVLSGNEYKIVDTLLKNDGGMKRSELERVTGIPKASLAAAINNLERKNIIEVDRTYTMHYIEVTKWFREL